MLRVKLHAIFLLLVLPFFVAGCGSSSHHFVYTVGTNSEGIFGFEEASLDPLNKKTKSEATNWLCHASVESSCQRKLPNEERSA